MTWDVGHPNRITRATVKDLGLPQGLSSRPCIRGLDRAPLQGLEPLNLEQSGAPSALWSCLELSGWSLERNLEPLEQRCKGALEPLEQP